MDIYQFIEPLSLSDWIKDYWGKKPFYNPRNNLATTEILTKETVHNFLKNPSFYETNSVFLRSTSFTFMEKPHSYDEVLSGIESGLTLQIRNLETVLPKESPIMKLASSIQAIILAPLNSITYFQSRPDSQPTAIHKDIAEIFSVQISGKKCWKLALEKDFSEKMFYEENEINQWETKELEPGNVMYLSSFIPHQVKCVDEESISVAMVFSNIQYSAFFEYIKEDRELKSWLLRPIPPIGNKILLPESLTEIRRFKSLFAEKIAKMDESHFVNFMQSILKDTLIQTPSINDHNV